MTRSCKEETVEGFILTRQWRETGDGQELIFWMASDRGPVRVSVAGEEPVFFVSTDDLDRAGRVLRHGPAWRSVSLDLRVFAPGGETRAAACYFRNQTGLRTARRRLEEAGIRVYEADIRPADRYLMERFITGSVRLRGELNIHPGFLACRQGKMAAAGFSPTLSVLSIDIETSWKDNILFSIAAYAENARKVFMVSPAPVQGPDYLETRADESGVILAFLDWVAKTDPDIVIGWSVVAFDLWFLQKRCEALGLEFRLGRDREPVVWRTSSRGRERHYAMVPGRMVLDGIELLRTATYTFESFALDAVARELLGRGKLVDDVDARASEIEQMYRNDKGALAEYNLEDCILVHEIFERTDLIEFAVQRSRLTGLEPDRAGGSVAAFDFLYLPRLHREGFIAPLASESGDGGTPGGYVLESRPGLYDGVIVLDFKSLYPSIIRTFHVDPLALVCAGEDAIEGFRGASFSRERCILPGIITELWEARDEAKRSGKTAVSRAIKIIMNSFYGVLGTPGCRFFDTRLVSSITMRGHQILKKTRDLIEARGYPVIYGDTDSVFVLLDRTASEVDRIGHELTAYLNDWWKRYLLEEYGLQSCLEVEYETRFDRFLMPTIRGSGIGSKKRYAGLIVDEDGSFELVFKGLETVRSDWTPLAREFQQELYRRIFFGEPFEDYIRNTVEAVLRGEKDGQLVLRRRLRRNLREYRKNIPPHVRAARREAEIRAARGLPEREEGGWIEYLMTLNGPEPRLYRESAIDYQFYIDRQLAPVADAILTFESTSMRTITDRQLGLF